MNQKTLSMLSMSCKAGKVRSGSFEVEESVKKNRAFLVIAAGDSSAGTKKKYADMCKFYNVSFYIDGTIDEISRAIGKSCRSAVAVTDRGLSCALVRLLKE
jgi:ribosomal protein L7Ae-like RNA K-turn-binding protein